jgi:hypothetical protein
MKYDDYEFAAIALEGSKGWPWMWDSTCDESFQKYKKAVDSGQKVSARPFLSAQKQLFAKMTEAERHCSVEIGPVKRKYGEYETMAEKLEGTKGWPAHWDAWCDDSFRKYKKAVDRGQKVSAKPFIDAQKRLYAEMSDEARMCKTRRRRPKRRRRSVGKNKI